MSDPAAPLLQLVALEAGLAALAVVAGFGLAAVPNVELVTFIVFLTGALFGVKSGVRVGVIASVAYGLLSPYGLPDPLLLTALVLGRVWIGALGGWFRPALHDGERWRRVLLFAAGGALGSLGFHALTNVALGITMSAWRTVLLGAIPFALIGIASNIVVFAILGVPCLEIARHIPIPGLVTFFRERK